MKYTYIWLICLYIYDFRVTCPKTPLRYPAVYHFDQNIFASTYLYCTKLTVNQEKKRILFLKSTLISLEKKM